MGHGTVAMTQDTHAHVLAEMQAKEIKAWAKFSLVIFVFG